jgi:hypothetical protein
MWCWWVRAGSWRHIRRCYEVGGWGRGGGGGGGGVTGLCWVVAGLGGFGAGSGSGDSFGCVHEATAGRLVGSVIHGVMMRETSACHPLPPLCCPVPSLIW